MNIKKSYCLDDVLLVPKHSDIETRKNVDISVDLGKGVKLCCPIVSSNMKSVTEHAMAIKMAQDIGGLSILHRFDDDKYNQLEEFKKHFSPNYLRDRVGCSVGVKPYDRLLADNLVAAGCKIICVDVAHGHADNCARMTEYVAKKYPEVLLISGNVATKTGALFLYNAGANIIKTGIGQGSTCSTRIETGNGIPSLTSLEEVFKASFSDDENDGYCYDTLYNTRKFKVLADGGLRRAGDLTKSLCFSDIVMLGNLLAGTDETPGDILESTDGKRYKKYAGSSTHKANHHEGVSGLVPYKGPVEKVIERLMEGLRSGLAYQGCHNLNELKQDPEFVLVTHAGLVESHPHDIKIVG